MPYGTSVKNYKRSRSGSRSTRRRQSSARTALVRKKRMASSRKYRILRQPFPNVTKRVLTYAFRDQIQPPTTSQGGFSVGSMRYDINYPHDIDYSNAATVSTTARRNHQPMGYDQLGTLYNKQRVDWATMKIHFAVEKPTIHIAENTNSAGGYNSATQGTHTQTVPIRVAILATKDGTLDPSTLTVNQATVAFEKLIEQSKSGMLPNGTSLVYRTLTHDRVVTLKRSMNCYKLFRKSENKSFADWREDNTVEFNHTPADRLHFHIIASPISVTPGDAHPKVTFYGDMQLGMTFSDLKEFGQS